MDRFPITIGRLAAEVGTAPENIRYYESQGMLSPPPRSASGYRQYSKEHLARLTFILRARDLGFSQAEVKTLLELARGSARRCDDVQRVAELHLADVQGKLADLKGIEKALSDLISHCERTGRVGKCPLVQALYKPYRHVK